MFIDTNFPPPDGRLAQLMRVVADFERDEIEAAVDGFIALLDARDGDPDTEDDERAGILMIAPGVDYDPYEDDDTPDDLPGVPEDAEDDDPAGGEITDEPHDAEEDFGAEDLGEQGSWKESDGAQQNAQAYPDDDLEDDDPLGRRRHRDRIRQTRCTKRVWHRSYGQTVDHRLLDEPARPSFGRVAR